MLVSSSRDSDLASHCRESTSLATDRVTAEIRERFQQLQNLEQKYAFLRPEVILSMKELYLDQAHQDINKEESNLSAYVYQLS
ncbi:hypothetical protein TNCV_2953681 [Trichonephila clavipes]|nr:hypothetical protein TNCV_2953681 [Trichonephila clavipes]